MIQGKIVQVLLLFEERNSREYGPALWAAFHEIERFYKPARPSLSFRRVYISPYIPGPSMWDSIKSNFGGMDKALELLRQEEKLTSTPDLSEISGPNRRNYDQRKLASSVRKLVGDEDSDLMVVTDRTITPPSDWRYIIWDTFLDGSAHAGVISAAPLDPRYWRDQDPDRIGTIKRRTRCAGLSVTGTFLGLKRCDDPDCYLFDDVASVDVLDDMSQLAHGHHLPQLEGHGFDSTVSDPTVVQPVVSVPESKWSSL